MEDSNLDGATGICKGQPEGIAARGAVLSMLNSVQGQRPRVGRTGARIKISEIGEPAGPSLAEQRNK
jgi:hypothetical protein